ncbi:DNA polymerase I, partial [Patescibacteria group bacterium]|nr:DNA polymerase I [Patescibacteria group bacterium]
MEQANKRQIFMVIDGNTIVHRAYHALPPFTTKSGIPTGAVYGFFSMTFKLIQELKPKYIAITFDRPKPTFRKALYVGYQAQRPKMDDGLGDQMKIVHEILEQAKICVYEVDGFEADDVIGTIVEKVNSEDNKSEVYVVSGDRDLLQLVNHKAKVLAPVEGISKV